MGTIDKKQKKYLQSKGVVMNEKAVIVTLNGYYNYGNRLQLFALATTLNKIGIYSLVYWPLDVKQKLKMGIKYNTPLSFFLYPKEMKLKTFTKRYIPTVTRDNEKIAVYGSDQVWNPNYIKTRPYLSNEAGEINISYAASMGVTSLSKEESEFFKNYLKNFKAISVREQSAKDLLSPLVPDKEVEVVLDPTLLVDDKKYAELEKKPDDVARGEKYVLCYILGNRDYEAVIDGFARRNNYRTIYFSDKRDSNYGIEEFLYLIHHAELICTDSFHACVFSTIFERPFVAFKRTGKANYMYTRLQNLIDTFKLKNREFNGKSITEENLKIDYTEAKKILKKEQEKSLNFLKKALDIKDEK